MVKNISGKKNFWPNLFGVKKCVGSKNVLGQKMCWVKKCLSKKIWVRKVYFWVEPKIGITNFLGQRKFVEKFWVKRILVQKMYGPKNFGS